MNQKIEVTSKRFWLNGKDFLKGLLISVGTGSLMVLQTALDAGEIHWKPVWMAGAAGGIAYLIKNFLQPAQMKQNITAEQVDAMKATTDTASK